MRSTTSIVTVTGFARIVMSKEPEKNGGLFPALLIVPMALCCLGPLFLIWAIGSGFFAWFAGANAVLAVAIALSIGGAAIYLVQSRRKSGLQQEGRNALRAARRTARSDVER